MGQENIWGISIAFGLLFASVVLYMIGGTAGFGEYNKAWRRFVASGLLSANAIMVSFMANSFDWRYFLMFIPIAVGFSLPYGGSSTAKKILQRTIYALGVLGACFVGLWITGFTFFGWVVMALALIIGLSSVVLGVVNPYKNAPLEQGLICLVLNMFVPFWGYIR